MGRPLPTLAMEMPFGCQLLPQAESSLEIGANVTVRPQVRGGVGMVCLSRWKVGASKHLFLLQGPQHLAVHTAAWKDLSCLSHGSHPQVCSRPLAALPCCLDLVSSDSVGTEVVTYSPEISQGLSDKHPKPGQKLPPWSRQRRCGPSISL